jgi:CBS-domain-containing membrane protein
MKVSVAHTMSHDVALAAPNHTVDNVRKLMASKRIHALPLVSGGTKVI